MPRNSFIRAVEERTTLAGSNKFEVLLFRLGPEGSETFGINVFKVREVVKVPSGKITALPGAPLGVLGATSVRGQIIPVVDMSRYTRPDVPSVPSDIALVTEYGGHTQAFMVSMVDRIIAVRWDEVRAYSEVMGATGDTYVTGVVQLDDGRLVSILDVEKVLYQFACPVSGDEYIQTVAPEHATKTVLYVDDSAVARRQIQSVLDRLGVKSIVCMNGAEALARLKALQGRAAAAGGSILDEVSVLLTDIEMPELDGYVLTREVKAAPALKALPVVMYSSLSSPANKVRGMAMGADAYVDKFEADTLASALYPFITGVSRT